MDQHSTEDLYCLAVDASKHAYTPHSRFPVGAALIAADGTVFSGANVDNASTGLSNCAERTAVFTAVTQGHRSFSAVAVAAPAHTVPPCGACLQVLAEFADDNMRVIFREAGEIAEYRLGDLLTRRFRFSSKS